MFGLEGVKETYRFMVYGGAKTGKTTFAMNFAKMGFNVIVLDGDRGQAAFRKMVREDQDIKKRDWSKNVLWLDLADKSIKVDDTEVSVLYYEELEKILSGVYVYNLTKQIPVNQRLKHDDNDHCAIINLKELDNDTILVIDSWTAVATSLEFKYPTESNTFLTNNDKYDARKAFMYRAEKANSVMQKILALNTSAIVIGHDALQGTKSVKEEVIEGRVVLQSVSKPHGATMLKQFSEVLYLHLNGKGERCLSTSPSKVGVYDMVASSTVFGKANGIVNDSNAIMKKIQEIVTIPIQNKNIFTDKSVKIAHNKQTLTSIEYLTNKQNINKE